MEDEEAFRERLAMLGWLSLRSGELEAATEAVLDALAVKFQPGGNFSALLKLIQERVTQFGVPEWATCDRERVLAWVTQAGQAMNERNVWIHATFRARYHEAPQVFETVSLHLKTRTMQSAEVSDIGRTAKKLELVTSECVLIRQALLPPPRHGPVPVTMTYTLDTAAIEELVRQARGHEEDQASATT